MANAHLKNALEYTDTRTQLQKSGAVKNGLAKVAEELCMSLS